MGLKFPGDFYQYLSRVRKHLAAVGIIALGGLLISSCAYLDIEIFVKTPTATVVPLIQPEITPTTPPTPTPIPKAYENDRNRIREIMEEYHFIELDYLSNAYWQLLTERINKFGPAERIMALEFHGNDYWMYDGAYSMNPETFYKQINYLMENDFHFVTIHELRGFIEGSVTLPKRSIILTTDSGYSSQKSMRSMISQFAELEEIYGYKPHFQSYIWTRYMTPEEEEACINDACWETFRIAKASGYFTFGTHSETHPYFERVNLEDTRKDLVISQEKILQNIGVFAYAIAWPHESCSPHIEMLKEIGIDIGFGGWSKPLTDGYAYQEDPQCLCLPRLFPPHGGGISARPNGETLEQMLENMMDY